MKKLTSTLIIIGILACSISTVVIVYALPGDLIWKKTNKPTSNAYGVAVYDTSVYVVGYDNRPGNPRWRIEKRSKTDGSLIWKKFSNPSSNNDVANGVAVDGTGVYACILGSVPQGVVPESSDQGGCVESPSNHAGCADELRVHGGREETLE